ncbi:MAG: NYN domain-containing protein [Ardenticatenia bacterium]|nr:NYN domain-containing protein [Ardenticatenia bacterium]
MQATRPKAAVFIDFENIAIAAQDAHGFFSLDAVMAEAERWGTCGVRRAYADWTRFRAYGETVSDHSLDLTQLFLPGGSRQRKNAVDIQLVVDALETALTRPEIEVFVIVGGDSDYSAVARRLRGHGRTVVGIGLKHATSPVLIRACNHFVAYGSLIGEGGATLSHDGMDAARALLLEALRRRSPRTEPGPVLAAALKHTMLSIDATFDELALGFPQFKDFLDSQADLVETRQTDQQLWVSPRQAADSAGAMDPATAYRIALRAAELRMVDPATRREVLQDLHRLLEDFPGEFSLGECVQELVSRYDAEGIGRDRNQVRDIVKLTRFADLFDPIPDAFQLDPLTLGDEVSEATFIDRCESVYLAACLEARLVMDPAVIAGLLFGSPEASDRVDQLLAVAADQLDFNGITVPESGWDWPPELVSQPELAAICREVDATALQEEPNLDRVLALADQGHAVRPKSFDQARHYFLQAAKMTLELLRSGAPGASQMDLETYVASYCFAAAGAHYLGFEYTRATEYYLAFFTLLKENRPVWDKMFGLVPPMLSYYFSTVLRALREPVAASPGFTHPANMAIQLHTHSNPEARQRWLELVADLRRVNPLMPRLVADRLVQLDEERGEQGAAQALQAMIQAA